MEVSAARLSGVPLIELKGEIDHGNAQELERALEDVLTADDKVVLLDLAETEYMDSSGVSQLLLILRQVRDGGWLGLIGPNENVMRLLQIVGLSHDNAVRIFATQDQAEAEAEAEATI